MAQPARVINMDDHRGSGPQVEGGHVRIANELYDAILEKLNSYRHLKVALAIVRKTYGYRKKEDDLTVSQLAKLTGIHRNNVGKALTELEEAGVINPVRPGEHGLIIGINKHHEEWATDDKKARGPGRQSIKTLHDGNQNVASRQSKQCIEAIKTLHDGNQNVASRQSKQCIEAIKTLHTTYNPNRQPQQTTPTDNPKRQARKPAAQDLPSIPEWMPADQWSDFVEHRKLRKAPMTALAAKRMIDRLAKLRADGFCPAKLLDAAIRNGWQDVYPRDDAKASVTASAHRSTSMGRIPAAENFASKDYGTGGLI